MDHDRPAHRSYNEREIGALIQRATELHEEAMGESCFTFYGEQIIQTTPAGNMDLESSKATLRKLASETTVDACMILLDLRWSPCRMTLDQMYALARALGNIDPPYNERIAILFDPSQCDQKTEPEVMAPTPGFTVAHFGVFEKAMRWLNTSDVVTNGG